MNDAALLPFLVAALIALTRFPVTRKLPAVDRLITVVLCLLSIAAGFAAVAYPELAGKLAFLSVAVAAFSALSWFAWRKSWLRWPLSRKKRKPSLSEEFILPTESKVIQGKPQYLDFISEGKKAAAKFAAITAEINKAKRKAHKRMGRRDRQLSRRQSWWWPTDVEEAHLKIAAKLASDFDAQSEAITACCSDYEKELEAVERSYQGMLTSGRVATTAEDLITFGAAFRELREVNQNRLDSELANKERLPRLKGNSRALNAALDRAVQASQREIKNIRKTIRVASKIEKAAADKVKETGES